MILVKIMELHGNYNQSITVTKKISSSKKELWNHISSPAYLNLSHPFCKENKVINWEDNNRSDILIYLLQIGKRIRDILYLLEKKIKINQK